MLDLYFCLTQRHDPRLVVLAALVCLVSSTTAISLLLRIRSRGARRPGLWLVAAAAASGCGIWSTHFIGILAYNADFGIGYDIGLTVLSLALAGGLTWLSFGVVLRPGWRAGPTVGGVMLGFSIAVMHYVGVAAVRLPGHLEWNWTQVALSIALAVGFGVGATTLAFERQARWRVPLAGLLLTLSICFLHFMGVSAARVVLDPELFAASPPAGPPVWLAPSVAAASLAIIASALAVMVLQNRSRRRAAELLHMRDLADAAVEGLVVCLDGRVVTANGNFERLVGLDGEELAGQFFAALVDAPGRVHGLGRLGQGRVELNLRRADGEAIPVELIVHPLRYTDRPHLGIAVRDLRDRRRVEDRIRFLAHHDPLTELPNRVACNEWLEEEIADPMAARRGVTFVAFDLDRFKEVNDSFGHGAGDTVLRSVAQRISATLEADDMFARVGGDEFSIIRRGRLDDRAQEELARRILAAAQAEIDVGGCTAGVGASIGIALYPEDGGTAESLRSSADIALYEAKNDGRNTWRRYRADLGAAMRERRSIESDLRHAVAAGQLRLVYQPQVHMDNSEPFGFEALLRWQHPQRGLVLPALFVPVAEETGLIQAVGEWVLWEACSQAAGWGRPLGISVNVSAVQIHSGDLPGLVARVLAATGLDPARLELEMTETALVRDVARAFRVLSDIKALGVRLAVDDFGTGFSSLSTIGVFPFDKIKIDRSFVRDVQGKPQAAAVARAIFNLARGLRMAVLAEGVESAEDRDFLVAEGCVEAQGYFYELPRDISFFAEMVAAAGPAAGPRPAAAASPAPAFDRP